VTVPEAPSTVRAAERIVWDFDDRNITWDLLRGRLGFRPGQLVVKGEGNTPVIRSPVSPAIDWSRYEAIRIRMIAERGREIKVRLGALEMKQELAPPMEWRVYRFDLKLSGSTFTRPMAIMPTDDLSAPVAIDFIELVPKTTRLESAAGRASFGKLEEYRGAIYTRSPSSLSYDVAVPRGAVLRFGLGVSSKQAVRFRITAGETELFAKTLSDPDRWEDAEVDLAAYAGKTVRLAFETSSDARDAVAFWANPLIASRAARRPPNVLLYVVCTLRPDHTSLYGYSRDTTPFLRKLGAAAVVFDDAQAQAPWTKPSVASLLTSLSAHAHGVAAETDAIPKGAATLAEQLRAAGYVTASIVANPFAGRMSGLDHGFDYMMEYPVVQRHRTDAVDRGTDSAAIHRAIAPWLERHLDEPFFLYMQSTDPHAPYRPPADFESKFANPAETDRFNNDYAKLRDIRAYGGGATVTQAEMRAKGIQPAVYKRQALDRYDGEIAHNDRSIESLFAKLKELGALDNTLVVIASDHGEEFWEHGFGAHGHSLYNELIHCVLLMWNPRMLPVPRRVGEPVQLIDVMPTVLELIGVKSPATTQGQSLVPLLRGREFERRGPVIASKLALPTAKPGGGVPENLTGTFAWIEPAWKLIYRDQARRAGLPEVELYDRRSDRAETNNVGAQQPEVVGRVRKELDRWIEGQKQVRKLLGPGGKTTLDPQTIERLRSLGYLGGAEQTR
jgi:arylsulfatase A-like enzyme